MANSTDVFWSVNGVSIQTLGFNVATRGGHAPPPLRGSDTLIPYRVGQQLEERIPDSRTLPFKMWAIGMDEDGLVGAYGPRSEYEKNYKKLRNLIWNQGRPITLTKRWKDYGSGTVQTATATGIYDGGLAEEMTGPARSDFGFDIFLADPFFYGAAVPVTFTAVATSTQNITVLGDYPTTKATLLVNGARTNFRLTNSTEGHYVNVNSVIGAGATATIDVDLWTAVKSAAPTNIIKDVTHFGHKHWLSLRPGAQSLVLSSSSGSASATLTYIPRWL